MSAVYLDHNATTPLDPRVREAMLPWLGSQHGNPSSIHSFGRAAREAVELARQEVAALIGARPGDVVFTSSGTEANNAVVLSLGSSRPSGRLVMSAMEHPSVQAAADRLEAGGWSVSRVDPGPSGRISPDSILERLQDHPDLVCLMLANNEIGTVQPVAEVAAGCREAGVPVLCDAVQAPGKIEVDVETLGVDFLTIGAHKFHGPLGAAALWIRPGGVIEPFLLGGGQERHRRAGTENVAALVGFGAAARFAKAELPERQAALSDLRDRLETELKRRMDVKIHGADVPRLPNTSHVAFRELPAESLMIRLDLRGFAVSAGAACSSGKVQRSPTLAAIGATDEEALSSIRVSFGVGNRPDDVDDFVRVLGEEAHKLARAGGTVS